MNDEVCKAHSGFKSKIETLEDNVSRLWEKWDSVQKLLIGTTVAIVLNLVGVITILVIK